MRSKLPLIPTWPGTHSSGPVTACVVQRDGSVQHKSFHFNHFVCKYPVDFRLDLEHKLGFFSETMKTGVIITIPLVLNAQSIAKDHLRADNNNNDHNYEHF